MKTSWLNIVCRGGASASLVASVAVVMSCGSGSVGGGAVPPTTHDGHEHDAKAFLNVGSRAEIEQAIAQGDVELRPGFTFQGILLHITSFERFDLELSYERPDGSRSDFFPVEPDEPEYPYANAAAILPEPAVAAWLRVKEGQQSIEFLAARFYEEVPLDGVLDIHEDYDPAYDEVQAGDELLEQRREGQLLTRQQAASRPGRWTPSDQALSGGARATFRYEGAPNWNSSACGGSLLAGTRDLAEHLMRNFGATHYGGYSCRQNTGNRSKMSVHGTGRAFDLHYNLHSGDADNDKGDPAANWLLENAAQIGVQMVIWDRTTWMVGRSGHRNYTGPHPHHDHLHVEITASAAARQTPFFGNPGSATTPDPGSGASTGSGDLGGNIGAEGGTCMSSTLGRRVPINSCVQMAYVKYGGRCNWARCSSGGTWLEQDSAQCAGTAFANSSCSGQNPIGDSGASTGSGGNTGGNMGSGGGASCHSQTLGRVVNHGTCVQVDYQGRTCSTCGWYSCTNGAWICTSESACGAGTKNPHASCGGGMPDPVMPVEPTDPMDPNMPHMREIDGSRVGNFKLTFYWLALEKDHPGAKTSSLPKCGGGSIAMVSASFLRAARLEGSAKLDDGRIVNVGSSTSCFDVLDPAKFPWGKGNRSNPLEPLRSIAVDRLIINNGNTIYIPSFDGLDIPRVGELGGFKHDGCFRADDVGGGINGYHFDFYAGTKEMYEALVGKVPSPTQLNDFANGKCAKYKR